MSLRIKEEKADGLIDFLTEVKIQKAICKKTLQVFIQRISKIVCSFYSITVDLICFKFHNSGFRSFFFRLRCVYTW